MKEPKPNENTMGDVLFVMTLIIMAIASVIGIAISAFLGNGTVFFLALLCLMVSLGILRAEKHFEDVISGS
jgi:hypothetical protein